MTTLRELLSQYSHDAAWSRWINYQFSKGTFNDDGSWTMPAWAVERWKRQANTLYIDLSEIEKESGRTEADKMINIIETWYGHD